ncbi:hypothetical protein [Kitasatospora sp. McL0602]|uniref:hypothetical protein n=1 Tax=Kitasatospora sp. McL0602 TaxID=3439530 RepID=UPI003F8CEB42
MPEQAGRFERFGVSIIRSPVTLLLAALGVLVTVLALSGALVASVLAVALTPLVVLYAAMRRDYSARIHGIPKMWTKPWRWSGDEISQGWREWAGFATSAQS